ncbi:mRNA (guanine-N(7))-methyltransferase, partial [Kipferlia bialata]|eukprot:g2473.t1
MCCAMLVCVCDVRDIGKLREFNNWVKAVLISHFGVSNNAALDLCGGKFGDLAKYMQLNASYVAVCDIALFSLREGILRYNKTLVKLGSDAAFNLEQAGKEVNDESILSRISEQAPVVDYIWGDCFLHKLRDHFKQQGASFPFVSCQFAMHYAFETEERAKMFFHNVGSLLKPKHHFVATLPNKRTILDRLAATNWEYSPEQPTPPRLGNEAYHIQFDALSGPADQIPEFGARYTFFLADAVDGVPEYLVDIDTMRRLAGEAGMELVLAVPFDKFHDEFAEPHSRQYRPSHQSHYEKRGLKPFSQILQDSPDQASVISLYHAVIFVKKGAVSQFSQ